MAESKSVSGYVEGRGDQAPICYQATITSSDFRRLVKKLKLGADTNTKITIPKEGQYALLLDEREGRLRIYSRLSPIFNEKFMTGEPPPIYDFPQLDIRAEGLRVILTGEATEPDIKQAKKERHAVTKWPIKLPDRQTKNRSRR